MYAFHFGRSPKRLYGAYDAPTAGHGRTAALLLAPWGPERLSAHTTLRTLSRRLAGAGVHAMRFDYSGAGDSFGDEADVSISSMLDDVAQAVDECVDLAQVDRVCLVGMRLGASLAVLSLDRLHGVEDVVLWDPIVDGKAFVDGLAGSATIVEGDAWDLYGYLLPAGMRDELAALSLGPMVGGPGLGRVLWHEESDPLPAGAAAGFAATPYSGHPPWAREGDFGSEALPIEAINHVVDLLRDDG